MVFGVARARRLDGIFMQFEASTTRWGQRIEKGRQAVPFLTKPAGRDYNE
jgi:hypothetical protein